MVAKQIFQQIAIVATLALGAVHTVQAQISLADATRLQRHVSLIDPRVSQELPQTLEEALRSIFSGADVVFSGTVTTIDTREGVVTIRFHVDDGVRGVATGAEYVLREWSGLWADDPARFQVGERRWMMLHATSSAGFASPVGGSLGSMVIRGEEPASVADLRWIAAAAVQSSPSSDTRLQAAARPMAAVPAAVVADVGSTDGAMLTGLFHAWQRSGAQQ